MKYIKATKKGNPENWTYLALSDDNTLQYSVSSKNREWKCQNKKQHTLKLIEKRAKDLFFSLREVSRLEVLTAIGSLPVEK